MRSMRIVGLGIFFFVFTSYLQAADDWTKESSVQVLQSSQGRNGLGSGTVIGVDTNGYDVLTCAHVILVFGFAEKQEGDGSWDAPIGETKVKPVGGEWQKARVLAYHRNCDLALLRVKDKKPKVKASPLASKVKYHDLEVIKCGYPGQRGRHTQVSTCLGKRSGLSSYHLLAEAESVVASVASESGDSGGGLFGTKDRCLIGVVWGKAQLEGEWRLCAVPLKEIQAFLKEAEWKKQDKVVATPAK